MAVKMVMGRLGASRDDVYVAAVEGAVATAPRRLGHSCWKYMLLSREQNKESVARRMHLSTCRYGHHLNLGEVLETSSRMIYEPYDLIRLPGDCFLWN